MGNHATGSFHSALMGAVVCAGLAGCSEADEGVYIEALLLGDHADASEFGSHVIVRAVPDYIDGFSPDRPYRGDRVLQADCPLEHTEIPLEFFLAGSDRVARGAPPRWLLLAWITDDPLATWVGEGELFGAAVFHFDRDSFGGYHALDLTVELDDVR